MIKNEYAEKTNVEGQEGRIWCILNHGVYHNNKPEKLKVVFVSQQNKKALVSTIIFFLVQISPTVRLRSTSVSKRGGGISR